MNYVAHTYVAREIDPNLGPGFAIGAMLPDIAAEAGTGINQDWLEGEVLWGVKLAEATHDAFYGSPEYQELRAQVRNSFGIVGAATHAQTGVELLLDGTLLDQDDQLVEGYRDALVWLQGNYQAIGRAGQDSELLTAYLEDFSYRGVPAYLVSTQGLAGILRRRFNVHQTTLPKILEAPHAAVREAAGSLLASVLAGIRRN